MIFSQDKLIMIEIFIYLFLLTCIKYYKEIIIIWKNYLVQTRSQDKSSGIKLLEAHGVGRNLDLNINPEKQHTNPKKVV